MTGLGLGASNPGCASKSEETKHGWEKHGWEKHGWEKHGWEKHGWEKQDWSWPRGLKSSKLQKQI
jgi:hypothetical protein